MCTGNGLNYYYGYDFKINITILLAVVAFAFNCQNMRRIYNVILFTQFNLLSSI